MMAYCSSTDLDFMDTDLQNEMEKILQGSDKFGFDCFLSSDSNNQQANVLDFDSNSNNIDDWIQNMQWGEQSKLTHNSLLDTSFEIENNNPNLLVNPQTVMPIHVMPKKTTQHSATMTMSNNEQNEHCLSSSPVTTVYTAKIVTPETICIPQRNVNNNLIQIPVQTVKVTNPSQNSPVLVEHLQNRQQKNITVTVSNSSPSVNNQYPTDPNSKVYPKPVYSYSCLIAMALKNSRNGSLPVSEIYNFMTEHFPYFKTAPDGWKNSVRHNLSLNKCFAKVETPKMNGNTKKGCLWALNPGKIEKMTEEIAKHRKKDLAAIKSSMSMPEKLELIEAGKAGPVGPPSPTPEEPRTPTSTPHHVHEMSRENIAKQNAALQNEVNILDGNLTMDHHNLTDFTLQNGIWDDLTPEISVELPLSTPSITTGLTINGSPITIQSVVSLSNSNLIQGNYTRTASPLLSQNTTASQSSQTPQPSRVLSAST